MSILSIPEELLDTILDLCIVTAADRPPWHVRSPERSHASLLLVNKTFLRIATPILYKTVFFRSRSQLSSILINTFRPNPKLASYVKVIILPGGAHDGVDELFQFCRNTQLLDVTLDKNPLGPGTTSRFGNSLRQMKRIRHLVIRKDAYLSQEKPKYIISQLSQAIRYWDSLESVNVMFRLSADSTVCAFASALSKAPNLKTFQTLLPAIWNTTSLTISQNPSLERILLSPDNELIGSHLFLMEARKHDRLMDLIKAGTPVMRVRSLSSPARSPPSLLPLCPIKNSPVTKHDASLVVGT